MRELPNSNNAHRVLYSENAQIAAIGSALLDNSLMRGPLANLAVSDFAGNAHRTIYSQMLELSEDGAPFDPCTVAQELEERGELERVGGRVYLSSLIDGAVPESGLVQRHVQTIQMLSRLRRLELFLEKQQRSVGEVGADPDRLLQELATGVEALGEGRDLDDHLLPNAPRNLSLRPEILTLSEVTPKEILD